MTIEYGSTEYKAWAARLVQTLETEKATILAALSDCSEVHDLTAEFLEGGVRLHFIVDAEHRCVTVTLDIPPTPDELH
ncbi:hypothetical protein ACKVEX_15170 [Rhodocyclaceae bacterium SMB388]